MSKLGRVVEAVEKYNQFVHDEVKRARTDKKFGRQMLDRWNGSKRTSPIGTAPTGLKLPRLALPEIDEAGRDRALLVRRRHCRASFLFERRVSRDVSRAAARASSSESKSGTNGKAKPRQERKERRSEARRDGRADASVLGLGSRKIRTSAFIFSARTSVRSASAPRSTARRFTASTATLTASLARSARAAWPSTRSKTWNGSTPASIWVRRISPPR